MAAPHWGHLQEHVWLKGGCVTKRSMPVCKAMSPSDARMPLRYNIGPKLVGLLSSEPPAERVSTPKIPMASWKGQGGGLLEKSTWRPREARTIVMGIMASGWLGMFPEINLYGKQVSRVQADVGVHTCAINRSGLVIVAGLCRAETDPRSQPHRISAGPRSEQAAVTSKNSCLSR